MNSTKVLSRVLVLNRDLPVGAAGFVLHLTNGFFVAGLSLGNQSIQLRFFGGHGFRVFGLR